MPWPKEDKSGSIPHGNRILFFYLQGKVHNIIYGDQTNFQGRSVRLKSKVFLEQSLKSFPPKMRLLVSFLVVQTMNQTYSQLNQNQINFTLPPMETVQKSCQSMYLHK